MRQGITAALLLAAALCGCAQAQQFTAGEWYINVHTQANPAGEVRGQIKPLNM